MIKSDNNTPISNDQDCYTAAWHIILLFLKHSLFTDKNVYLKFYLLLCGVVAADTLGIQEQLMYAEVCTKILSPNTKRLSALSIHILSFSSFSFQLLTRLV